MNVTGRKQVLHRVLSVVLSLAMVLGSMVSGSWQVTQAAGTEAEEHHYDENGFCTDTGCEQPYQKPEGAGTSDSPYLIGNAGQLYYFAGVVNGDTNICIGDVSCNQEACAKLTADIVLNEGTVNGKKDGLREWTVADTYEGTFDGDNHIISGLYVNKTDNSSVGLFGILRGTCKNVGIVNSYLCTGGGKFGSIAARLSGRIENCYSTASLESKESFYAGGLAGELLSVDSVVKSSYFAGDVRGSFDREHVFGGITGYYTYNPSALQGTFRGSCVDCYYVSGVAVNVVRDGSAARTQQQFASGQVAYELNGDQSKIVFGQTLSGEAVSPEAVQLLPVLGGKRVCAEGHSTCPEAEMTYLRFYNGTEDGVTYDYPEHNYDNGICTYCHLYDVPEGIGSLSSPYLINNAGQLYYFVGIVNGDSNICTNGVKKNPNACAKLTADIILNKGIVNGKDSRLTEWTMIREYYGTFDGNNHTISGLYINKTDGSEAGFFYHLNGTCKNLGIVNSYMYTSDGNIGSITDELRGTIENCYSTACLEADESEYAGGLAGNLYDRRCAVRNSYFAGTVQGSFDREHVFGGITGYGNYNSLEKTGSFTGTCENCYYVSGTAVNAVREGAEARTLRQFASGRVTYELNRYQTTRIYGQTLSGEGVSPEEVQLLPVLGGEPVCAAGNLTCPGEELTSLQFLNGTEDEVTYDYPEHDYDNGFCRHCDGFEMPEGKGTKNKPYLISNAGQLYYYAGILNGSKEVCINGVSRNKSACAKLTADIVLNKGTVSGESVGLREWTIIDESYGIFDGDKHTISGLYINATGDKNVGFFSYLGGTCRNVGIVNSYIRTGEGAIGTITGRLDGTIENCFSTACLEADDTYYAGGLAGKLYYGSCAVRNSYFAGTVQGSFDRENVFGGITGYCNYDEWENEGIFYGTCENCYYISGTAVNAVREGAEARTLSQFASGQVAYDLRGSVRSVIFGQTLSGEAVSAEEVQLLPVLGGKRVCKKGYAICPGSTDSDLIGYFNGKADKMEYKYPNHHCDKAAENPYLCLECGQVKEHTCRYENGFCKYCDAYEVPKGKGTQTEPYQIENGGQLYYFAGIVNGDENVCTGSIGQNMTACAKLTGDIVLNEGVVSGAGAGLREWPIMNDYEGTFDGDNHTISGLYIGQTDKACVGFFGRLSGTCKNVGIVNSYIYTEDGDIGSFAGEISGWIENCYSTACLEADESEHAGGLTGYVYSASVVKNSYFAGSVRGSFDRENVFGGITGYHSYDSLGNTGSFAGTCENCYYVSGVAVNAVREGAEARTAGQFASGQVAYELNGDQSVLAFGQTLSGEAVLAEAVETLPVLGGKQVYEVMQKPCPGVKDNDSSNISQRIYTNDVKMAYSYQYPNHNFDADGDGTDDRYTCIYCGHIKEHEHVFDKELKCTLCGSYEEPVGNGTEEDPYRIANVSQLRWFVEKLNIATDEEEVDACVVLTEDIVLNEAGVTAGAVDAYCWASIEEYPEDAVFDGQGHTIQGLCYAGSESSGFIYDNYGTICDVTFAGVSVVVTGEAGTVSWGTACNYNRGKISGVTAIGEVTGNCARVGGICNYNKGAIADCTTYINITGVDMSAGGICRRTNTADDVITGCVNYGKITVHGGDDVGGIVADNDDETDILNCINYGDIETWDISDVGGIVGLVDDEDITIKNCINYGDVNATDGDDVGGIAGGVDDNDTEITNCANEGTITGEESVGGICGEADYVKIRRCYNNGSVTAAYRMAGGILGDDDDSSSIRYCVNTGTIYAGTDCGYQEAGAILGDEDDSSVGDCFYLEGSAASGIGFDCEDCGEHESYDTDFVESGITRLSAEAFSGGAVVWLLNNAAGERWLHQTDEGKPVLAMEGMGGYPVARKALFGCSGCTEPLSVEYFCGEEDVENYVYRIHNYDATTLICTECGDILPHLCIYGEDGYCKVCHGIRKPEGNGTEEQPYEIGNVAELYWFAGVVNGDKKICKGKITKNVNACAILTDDIVINKEPLLAETSGASVWVPIGMLGGDDWYESMRNDAYRGCFDGQGHTVTGVYVPEDADKCSGFFGNIGFEACIKNLNLENVYIVGDWYAGGICNYAAYNARIEGCSVSGIVSAEEFAGGITSGISNDVVISGCRNMAQITGVFAGGIVSDFYGGSLTGCYNTGVVSGNAVWETCGIVGYPYDEFTDVSGCYYLTETGSETETGGIQDGFGEPAGAEEFASGMVTYKMNAALKQKKYEAGYGQILSGDKAQKFPVWNEATKVSAIGVASCPGVEAISPEGYSNDSTGIEYVYENHLYEGGSYYCTFCGTMKEHTCEYVDGCCKYCNNNKKPAGEGTKEAPYQIGSVEELLWFRDMVSGDLANVGANAAACAVLTADIDIQLYAERTGKTVYWTSVGVSEQTGKVTGYEGTFDGQGHTISGLLQTAYDTDESIGVFAQIGSKGVVQNVHIKESEQSVGFDNVYDSSYAESYYLGAFCNKNQGMISGCSIEADFNISGCDSYYMAGFVGVNDGTIANSNASGLVQGIEPDFNGSIAGFCAWNRGLLKDCDNEADIEGCYGGGVCYYNEGTMENCENSGKVTVESRGAGIGRYNYGRIENCENSGEIYSADDGAGICYTNVGTIKSCENSGEVTTQDDGAGICFDNYRMIKDCENSGTITTRYYTAGICVHNKETIENCENSGEIYSADVGAGICYDSDGTIEMCTNRMAVTAEYSACGICYCNYGTIKSCVNMAEIVNEEYETYRSGICYENAGGTILYCCNSGEAYYGLVRYCEGSVEYSYAMEDANEDLVYEGWDYLDNCELLPEDDFVSGRLTYLLNQVQGKEVFGQTLYTEDETGTPMISPNEVDNCPVPGGRKVYPQLILNCPGCNTFDETAKKITGYSNTPLPVSYEYPEHYYYADEEGTASSERCYYCGCSGEEHICTYENGICTTCGWFEAPEGNGTKEAPYEIGNAGELCYFAYVVEGASMAGNATNGNATACAVLTADINLAQVPEMTKAAGISLSGSTLLWSAAGSVSNTVYEGTFDGNGYSILGFRCEQEEGALFAELGKTAVVKNVTVSDCSIRGVKVAGISVINNGTIENCMVSGRIEGCDRDSEKYLAGGICAVNHGTIQSCFVSGVVAVKSRSGADLAGFLCAENTDGAVKNCYYYNTAAEESGADVTATASLEDGFATGKGMGRTDYSGMTKNVTMSDVHSGKVAWMLDTGNTFEGNKGIWKQDETTSLPSLAGEGTVTMYYLYAMKADKSMQEYYIPAGAELSKYLSNTEGTTWVYAGGSAELADGTIFEETTMNRPVICIREAYLPTGTITVKDKSWTAFTKTDGYKLHMARGNVLDIKADSPNTKIAYYIHKADRATEPALTLKELMKKSFTAYDAADKPVLNEKGYVVVYVRLTGADGMVNYMSTEGLEIRNPYLLSITAPEAITGVPNGTKKDAVSLGLPSTVTIKTEDERITSAAVTWNLTNLVSGSYDSTLTTKQTFTVEGTVVLPDDVDANGITLTVRVTVTVDAKKADVPSGSPNPSEQPDVSPNPTDKPDVSPNPTDKPDVSPNPTDKPDVSPNPTDKPDVSPNPSESVTKGDVDDNGKVELADAQLALKAALKIIKLDEKASKAADVTGNGKVELADAQLILKYALKIIKTFD